MTRANDDDAGAAGIGAVAHMTRANDDDAGAAGIGAVAHMTRANDDDAGAAASSPGWALLPGSSSPRCAGRIVARLGPIARLLLAPLRGPHRRQAGPYCPAPPLGG